MGRADAISVYHLGMFYRGRWRKNHGDGRPGGSLLAVGLVVMLAGCGEDEAPPAAPGCPPGAREHLAASMHNAQAVLDIASSKGQNLAAARSQLGDPDPELYLSLAESLGQLEPAATNPSPFGSTADIQSGLVTLAGRLDAALSATADTDPAWASLEAFAGENLVRLQAGANYIIANAGCLD